MAPQKGKRRMAKSAGTYATVSKPYRTGEHRSKYANMRTSKWTLDRPTRKAVEAIIHKEAETKITMFSSNYTAYNQMVNGSEAIRLLPDIANGTGGNQKLGNKIRLQRLKFRGVLCFSLPQSTINNTRIGVRMTIMRLKQFDDWQQSNLALAAGYTKLLEGYAGGMDGTVFAHNTPLNLDYCTKVTDKRFVFSFAQSSGTVSSQDVNNSFRMINFDIPYSRRFLNFDPDTSSNQPVDYPYFAVLSYCKLDGTAVDLPATAYLNLQYTVKAEFEDA